MKLLEECCQKVEETLTHYHNGHHADQSSRKLQYVCQCSPSKEVHYIQDIDAEKQTCSDPVYCKRKRRPRSLTSNESNWFNEERKGDLKLLQKIPPLKDDDDTKPTIQNVDSAKNYPPTQTSESNDDQQKVILTIRNLVDIIRVLEKGYFQNKKWRKLGLYLGLIHTDLKTIEENYPRDAERCLEECLAKWLTEDIEATWEKLAIAAGEVGEISVAEYIRSRREL